MSVLDYWKAVDEDERGNKIMSNTFITNLTQENRDKLKKAVKELSDSYTRVEAERDLQKSIVSAISEEIQAEKKMVRKMSRTYHKGTFAIEAADNDEFEAAYIEVIGQ